MSITGGSMCEPFEGNPDFYGLGIRLGVYLQIISTWITNTLNENATADTHAANSIFLLAIIVAVASAAASQEIRPVEVWIMLQICLIFPITVVGIFGARTNFLSTAAIRSMIDRFLSLSHAISLRLPIQIAPLTMEMQISMEAIYSESGRSPEIQVQDETVVHLERPEQIAGPDIGVNFILDFFSLPGMNLSFKALSLLKHFSLTWVSSIWRTLILSSLVATNLWFWFRYWDQSFCGYSVFLLARVHPGGPIATFFKVGAIILAAAAAIPLFVSLGFLFIAVRYAISLLTRRPHDTPSFKELSKAFVYFSTKPTELRPRTSSHAAQAKKKSRAVKMKMRMDAGFTGMPGFDASASYDISKDTKISETPATHEEREDQETKGASYSVMICLIYHLIIILMIAYFILSIELTIIWNGITEVHDIKSTGQLIPFVIGVMSSIRAIQEVVLGILSKSVNVDGMDFAVSMGFETGEGFRLIRREIPQARVVRRGRIHWETPDAATLEPGDTTGPRPNDPLVQTVVSNRRPVPITRRNTWPGITTKDDTA